MFISVALRNIFKNNKVFWQHRWDDSSQFNTACQNILKNSTISEIYGPIIYLNIYKVGDKSYRKEYDISIGHTMLANIV